jgi:ElaB/YqjD/DUF883 family membrane-anchored ribosome-binding protein
METTAYGTSPATSGTPNNSDGALKRATSNAHAVVASIADAADEATRKAKPAIDQVTAMAHQTVDKTAGAVAPAADWLTDQGAGLNATQKKLMGDTCGYISANPLTSIGIAVAAGFVLGRMIR